jgi:hypothetical protein
MKTSEPTLSWYGVSPDVKQLLVSATQNWENTTKSEQYMYQALAKNDITLDVLIAAYRYFLYKNNNPMALKKEIDTKNELGASVILDILTYSEGEEE